MDVIGVIPARYESTRLPHKLVREVCGKPLLQWTWENASRAHLLDELIIACDDCKVEKMAQQFGARVVMTSPQQPSGTDRVAEAVRDKDAKVIVNIQADEPLIHPPIIDRLAQEMLDNEEVFMATAKIKIDKPELISDSNVVKVICDKESFAVYFSRLPVPFFRDPVKERIYYKHFGIYAYTKESLFTFKNLPPSFLEEAEKLEQLRALESGFKIKVIETKFDSQGVDTEQDLFKLENILKENRYESADD